MDNYFLMEGHLYIVAKVNIDMQVEPRAAPLRGSNLASGSIINFHAGGPGLPNYIRQPNLRIWGGI